MNEVIEHIYRSGQVQDADGTPHARDVSPVSYETGVLLYEFVRATKPARTLEVGLAYGLSTLFICQALRDNGFGQHTAIDPFEETSYGSIGLLNVERAHLSDLLHFHGDASEKVLPRLYTQNERFDFAFIDGSHLFDHAFVDFFYIDKMIGAGSCIALDDLWMPSVRKVMVFALTNKPYELMRFRPSRSIPARTRVLNAGRRILQNPFGRDWRLKLVPGNVGILKKLEAGERAWDFHRAF